MTDHETAAAGMRAGAMLSGPVGELLELPALLPVFELPEARRVIALGAAVAYIAGRDLKRVGAGVVIETAKVYEHYLATGELVDGKPVPPMLSAMQGKGGADAA